ncbi:MAG TPA: Asp-tRNA(Asn)/Glu-tRNA(Gln) amidotransferase subunit GatB [Candidatus Paceibacterota bacterium]
MEYKLTVGLEIHAELNTKTKMFCDSKNDPDEKTPNTNVCPICMGYPGTLPVINKEAVRKVLFLGVAVGGEIADYSEFDRKNYFYPDIPKGYQISQYKFPLIKGGELEGVKITRIHLEEDVASLQHARSSHDDKYSMIDFNRAGIPLLELVTEPVINSADVASKFAKELQLLLTYLDISNANLEKGEMRIEANVSIDMGTKVEVKNLNSFKSVEKAIKYEYERQKAILDKGEQVTQETRGWDENKQETFSQRLKESSHDYRYFPDPDLPKLFITEIPEFKNIELPELPQEKRARLLKLGITPENVEIYVTQPELSRYFEEVTLILKDLGLFILASNYIISDLKKLVDKEQFVEVIRMISRGELSSRGAKEVLKVLQESGGESRAIALDKDLMQISDRGELEKLVKEVLKEENKSTNVNYLVGIAMKKSGGKANPVILQEIFSK